VDNHVFNKSPNSEISQWGLQKINYVDFLLGIGLQKQYCKAENKILKSKNEFYEEQAKKNVILKISCKSETLT
jgi:hypothetical protein